MIVKPLEPLISLLQTEALASRLHSDHTQKEEVRNDARILRAGYNGEKSLSYTISLIDKPSLHIFRNLRIQDGIGFFQIDNLIVSRHYCVIIEVKNIYGTVTFDDMGQMIRTIGETDEGFRNPIEQVIKQEYRLRRWMQNNRLPSLPIERIIVFSHSATLLRNLTNERMIANLVIHEDRLFSKLTSIESKYPEPSITSRQLNRLSKKLLEAHSSQKLAILEKYAIRKEELMRGVLCEQCSTFTMIRYHGKWKCVKCGEESFDAHIAALKDYALLVQEEVSNREVREFLQVDSIHVTKRLLLMGNFEQIGVTSGRKYRLKFDFASES